MPSCWASSSARSQVAPMRTLRLGVTPVAGRPGRRFGSVSCSMHETVPQNLLPTSGFVWYSKYIRESERGRPEMTKTEIETQSSETRRDLWFATVNRLDRVTPYLQRRLDTLTRKAG